MNVVSQIGDFTYIDNILLYIRIIIFWKAVNDLEQGVKNKDFKNHKIIDDFNNKISYYRINEKQNEVNL